VVSIDEKTSGKISDATVPLSLQSKKRMKKIIKIQFIFHLTYETKANCLLSNIAILSWPLPNVFILHYNKMWKLDYDIFSQTGQYGDWRMR
jgi:hypothetical protein